MGHATPWEAIVAQPHLVVLVILLLGLHRYITQNWAVPHVELHLYQYNFLTTLGGPTGASGGLQIILTRALAERQVREEIFGLVHCRHCGSVQPAEWIASAKGEKKRYSVDLPVSQQAFLKRPLISPVERVGEPPVKQIVAAGPKRADPQKAARCCVDWAIKEYGAEADGTLATQGGGKKNE